MLEGMVATLVAGTSLRDRYLARTPRGRVATKRAFEHLGRKPPTGLQGSLL